MLGNWFTKTYSVRIYLKSGNVLELDSVMEHAFKVNGDDVYTVRVVQHPSAKNKLVLSVLSLSQIEAVVLVR